MSVNLIGRSMLTLKDFTSEEIRYLLDLAAELKSMKKNGIRRKYLEGKNIALIFEKTSTRTRCAFTVAAFDEGAHAEYLGKNDIQLGKKESVKDTARVLGRMFDGIEFRGYSHETVEILSEYAGVPVWNGLTDKFHPTQVLADLLTIEEQIGKLKGVKFAYCGDGRNNMANSLMIGCAKMGLDCRIATPEQLMPEPELVNEVLNICKETGGKLTLTDNIFEGVKDAEVLYTDVWISMGEEDKLNERLKLLRPYQINMDVIRATKNNNVIFLHCLPAFHDKSTNMSKNIGEMEVTDEVFESKFSKVFEQAENRLHTIKAVMVATIGKK